MEIMENETSGYEILEKREDGTFVIVKDGAPYHVTPGYCPELWVAVCAQEGADPIAQAEIYAASLLPLEAGVVEEPTS